MEWIKKWPGLLYFVMVPVVAVCLAFGWLLFGYEEPDETTGYLY